MSPPKPTCSVRTVFESTCSMPVNRHCHRKMRTRREKKLNSTVTGKHKSTASTAENSQLHYGCHASKFLVQSIGRRRLGLIEFCKPPSRTPGVMQASFFRILQKNIMSVRVSQTGAAFRSLYSSTLSTKTSKRHPGQAVKRLSKRSLVTGHLLVLRFHHSVGMPKRLCRRWSSLEPLLGTS